MSAACLCGQQTKILWARVHKSLHELLTGSVVHLLSVPREKYSAAETYSRSLALVFSGPGSTQQILPRILHPGCNSLLKMKDS